MEVEPYSISQPFRQRDYEICDFEAVKKSFEYVSAEWLEAQRKVEVQKGVIEEERLSRCIQVKHLHGRKVMLDGADVRRECEGDARRMGATIVNNYQDHCLVITGRVTGEMATRARKFKGVKVLRPEFISDCVRCNALMEEKDYFHRLPSR